MFLVLSGEKNAIKLVFQISQEVNFQFSHALVILLHGCFEKVDNYRQEIKKNPKVKQPFSTCFAQREVIF